MLFSDVLPQGYGGRCAFGTVILVYVVTYNETCGSTVIFSALLSAFYGLLSAICKSGVKYVQIPYIRASNKFDFVCLFLALWMDALAILGACAALARTLSTCLDTLSGGLARILILGRNSPPNEPWPDVLGVSVVFLITGMFMLGLENNRAFSILMALGVLGVNGILTIVSSLKGNFNEWKKDSYLNEEWKNLLTAAALNTFSYTSEMPNKKGWKRIFGVFLVFTTCVSIMLVAGSLSMLIHTKFEGVYTVIPIFTLLENIKYQKLIPATACLLVLAASGSFLELFPELYGAVVRLATSEWKILTKQISYESPDSGNPVLAIFIGGSLCAMLAFACPLQNLIHLLAASHICGGLLRAFYLLYSPFRPKFIQQSCDSNLSYSRLSTNPPTNDISGRRSIWNLNFPIQGTLQKSRTKKKIKSEVEKEWLLLGEPSSPCPVTRERDAESSILSEGEPTVSDFECNARMDNTDSDISTDIDAIVDEYRQKVKVTTAGPMEKTIRVPSEASWRLTIFAIVVILFGIGLAIFGTFLNFPPAYIIGYIGIFLVSFMMSFIPKYTGNSAVHVSTITCTTALVLGFLLLSACLTESWPAVIFWLLAGLILSIRCDKWFCSCFDYHHPSNHHIISSLSGKASLVATGATASGSSTKKQTIKIPRPPKGLLMPATIRGHR